MASILTSGQKLSRLVEDGLQLTLIEGGHPPYDIAPFDVEALVRRSVAEVDAESNPVGFQLDLEADLPNAVGDEQRCWQVLTNLISNAVKYSGRLEPIEASVSRQGESIRIDIKDRGMASP